MRKNKRDNKTKYLLILLLLIAVGYAAIATTLKINGSSTIKSAKWDVYWENPHVIDGSVTNTAPTLSENDTKATFDVTLNEPGDYYEFTIDAVNNGSLDAKIDTNGIVKQIKNSRDEVVNPKILKYEVTNNDQEHTAIEEGHILAKKSGNTPTKETYRVRVEYRKDEGINPSDLDDNDLTFTIEFSIKYVQGPKTEPPETWDRFYYADSESWDRLEGVNSLGNNIAYNMWAQKNTSNGKKEVCHIFSGNTICLNPALIDYDSINPTINNGENPLTMSPIENNNNYYCNESEYNLDDTRNICYKCSDDYYYDTDTGKCYSNSNSADMYYNDEIQKYVECPSSEYHYNETDNKCEKFIYPANGYSINKINEIEAAGGVCNYDERGINCLDNIDGTYCGAYDEYGRGEITPYVECHNYNSLSIEVNNKEIIIN